ncbi:hypothetical protein SAMN05192551_10462 [Tindallia magadiensis]|uniref:Uncharacterized protein n=1 Tax=Tindallia magadiensis TaxID=69895 RepID=A0A1I3DQD7_9FIRM|nr:hypothetical protein SAMN05192551_10462 [Tindallia magadiensis]
MEYLEKIKKGYFDIAMLLRFLLLIKATLSINGTLLAYFNSIRNSC